MRRRQFLASGTALLSVAVAGCAHPNVVLDMEDPTAEDIAADASMLVDPGSEEYSVVTSAIENESATRRGSTALFSQTNTVRVNGSFFVVNETRLHKSEVTVYEVLIDFNPDDTTPEHGEIVFGDLPETDRLRLEETLTDDNPPEEDRYDVSVDYGSADEVGNDSVFVPELQYDIILYEGNRYRVAVNPRTAAEARYRYEVTKVANNVKSYADKLRERYRFTLSGLSDAERGVVQEAIDGGYYEDDEAFRSLFKKIRAHKGLSETDSYGKWLLTYENSEYLVYAEW